MNGWNQERYAEVVEVKWLRSLQERVQYYGRSHILNESYDATSFNFQRIRCLRSSITFVTDKAAGVVNI